MSSTRPEPDVIADWIRRVNEEGSNLSDYETDFMYSLTDQWDRARRISDRQLMVLERIYTEKVP
jgi:hypothetical protein